MSMLEQSLLKHGPCSTDLLEQFLESCSLWEVHVGSVQERIIVWEESYARAGAESDQKGAAERKDYGLITALVLYSPCCLAGKR